jgi:hypothetical protein
MNINDNFRGISEIYGVQFSEKFRSFHGALTGFVPKHSRSLVLALACLKIQCLLLNLIFHRFSPENGILKKKIVERRIGDFC